MKYGAAMYVEKGRSGEREREREESRGKKFGHRRIEGCVRREREEGEEGGGRMDDRTRDGNVERARTGAGVGHSRDISWLSLY